MLDSLNLCPHCKQPTINGICTNCSDLPPAYSIGPREGLLDLIIHDFKYHSVRSLGVSLANLLDASLPPDLQNAIIVPLPTATHHIRSRGLDHTLYVAKRLSRTRKFPIQKLLLRQQNTTQVGTTRQKRLAQATNAYAIDHHIKIDPSKTYILFDDVWTTGASMRAAIKKLQQAGAQHIIVALLAISRID